MDTHLTYFSILAGALAGPLFLSFDKKVAFYKKWKFLFPAMIFPALIYIAWDILFTRWGVWSFNQLYISGIYLYNLPLEEILFFLVVPYCCVFIYECICTYFPGVKVRKEWNVILFGLGFASLVVSIAFHSRHYTTFTFGGLAVFIFLYFMLRKYFTSFKVTAFLISYAVILIPFLVVNGFLTAIPVVLYNDNENLGIRVTTIPFEDIFYGMLLIFINVLIYEKLKTRFK